MRIKQRNYFQLLLLQPYSVCLSLITILITASISCLTCTAALQPLLRKAFFLKTRVSGISVFGSNCRTIECVNRVTTAHQPLHAKHLPSWVINGRRLSHDFIGPQSFPGPPLRIYVFGIYRDERFLSISLGYSFGRKNGLLKGFYSRLRCR